MRINNKTMEISKIQLVRLPNQMHASMMTECYDYVMAMEVENEKFKTTREAFAAAFKVEDKWYKRGLKDPNLAERNRLSTDRYKVYRALLSVLQGVEMGGCTAAAEASKLLAFFSVYKVETIDNVMGVTTDIRNLIQDLAEESCQTALTACNAMELYNKLKQVNEQVAKQCELSRDFSVSYVKEALQHAREAVDVAYQDLALVIQSLAVVMGEPYEAASAKLNAIVVYYKDVMRRREVARKAAKKKEEEQAGGDKKPGTDGKPSQGQTGGNASQGTGSQGSGTDQEPGKNPSTGEGTGEGSADQPNPNPDKGEEGSSGIITPVMPANEQKANK